MKFEELWNKLLDNEDLLNYYDDLEMIFSQKLEESIIEDYDVGEVLTEFIGTYEEAKEVEKIIAFTALLREKNNEVFEEVAFYFYDFLVEYYCFIKDEEQLAIIIEDIANSNLPDYDYFFKSLKLLFYNGYINIGNNLIEKTYPKLSNNHNLTTEFILQIEFLKYRVELGNTYYSSSQEGFNWQLFQEKLLPFGFDFTNERIAFLEETFLVNPKTFAENFLTNFHSKKHRMSKLDQLEQGFNRYVKTFGLHLTVGAGIWDKMIDFWENKLIVPTKRSYFKLKKKPFKSFLKDNMGFMTDLRMVPVLILWGSAYVYDFLLRIDLISEKDYEEAKNIIGEFKRDIISENEVDLWKYNFVCNWGKPEMVSTEEYDVEKKIFEMSLHKKEVDIKDDRAYFFDLSKEEEQANLAAFERAMRSKSVITDDYPNPIKRKIPKIGRNEKITVKYLDGNILRDVKFKKVKDDLENGECEII